METLNFYEPPSGGRVSSPKFREATLTSEAFKGLPEGVTRYHLLNLVKKVGPEAGFSAKMIHLLEYYIHFTREDDWQDGARPIVYQALSKTALDLGVGERQIQKLEQALFKLGALTWNDCGNYKRYGWRDAKTGHIVEAFGVDLSPLASLQLMLDETLQNKRLYQDAWAEQKRQISWHRAQIRALIAEAGDHGLDTSDVARDYDAINYTLRAYMDLEKLTELRRQHADLRERLLAMLDTGDVQEDNPSSVSGLFPNNTSMDVQNGVHIYSTTLNQSDKSDYSSQGIAFRESVAASSPPKRVDRASGNAEKGVEAPARVTTGFDKITTKQVLNAASERFRSRIPITGNALSWSDIVDAANDLLHDLGINKTAWYDACAVMNRYSAAISVMIIDQKMHDPKTKIGNPGGYLRAMTGRAKKGELNLQQGVFGLLKKDEKKHDA
jgi:replication initiation protein RepC